ncbi:WYL domain-containing protein [Trinickia mobilis]|uniref:WYL domain-containing protein n=1 Tax=Trinickia mobilis TaxID=2816356 RepID=UPI001A905D72|nr:WYL domain-containing protein [Trinickia mobilis]
MHETESTPQRPMIDDLPRPQRERLAHIDFALYFLGELRRLDLAGKFETGPAGATRDIAVYRDYAPENCELDPAQKVYRPLPTFKPLFRHSSRRVLTALSEGFGEGLGDELEPLVRCDIPSPLSVPDTSIIAPISRAIHRGLAVRLHYTSVQSGRTEKTLVPIALVDNGIRWHVRAFDREKQEFRDYVLTRMENPVVLEDSPAKRDESAENDPQWSRIIQLDLVPHPTHPRPELVKMDYGMLDGVFRLKVRAATAGYMLRRWSVDCSPNHELPYIEHPLWLPDPLALYGANNAQLAPGYIDPKELAEKIKAL